MRLATGLALFVASFLLNAGGIALPAENLPTVEESDEAIAAMASKNESESPSAPGNTPTLSAIEPYRVEYSASYNGLPITTVRTFKKEGNDYQVATRASNFLGTITEHETFRQARTHAIKPVRYHYSRSIFGKKRTEESVFDHQQQLITNTYKKKTVTMENTGETLGPLSYQVQLQLDLLAGLKAFTYPVVTRGKVKEYRYRIVGDEKLDTPMGAIDTLVLERVRDTNERETFLWLAEKFQFLPVKILQKEDGESYQMLIKSYTLTRE